MAASPSVKLSPMDNVMPRIYANSIFALRLNPGPVSAVHEVLQESLRRTCGELPVLRYRVFEMAPGDDGVTGRLEARAHPDWTPSVVFQDLSESWPEYDELAYSGLEQDLLDGDVLLPKEIKGWDLKTQGAPVLLAQANFVEGGLLLAFGVFHPVIDGHSGSLLMKLWAKHARAVQQEDVVDSGPALAMHPESGDYGILERIWRDETEDTRTKSEVLEAASAETWRLLGLLAPSEPSPAAPDPDAPPPKMRTTIFYISASAFEALRAEANQKGARSDDGDYGDDCDATRNTANDALMAKLWRCVIRARAQAAAASGTGDEDSSYYAPDSTSELDLTLDGRGLFSSSTSSTTTTTSSSSSSSSKSKSLPWSYMGTLIFIATTRMSVGRLTDAHTPLTEIATEIRRSVDAITPGRLHEAFGLARSLPDYDLGHSLRFPFATLAGAEACFTSWVGLSGFDIRFGGDGDGLPLFANGGRADFLRPPRREYDALCRRCVVLPMQASGGFEVLLTMKEREMDVIERDAELLQYAQVVSH